MTYGEIYYAQMRELVHLPFDSVGLLIKCIHDVII
jgi:hypothetical protein